jgi:putative transposase
MPRESRRSIIRQENGATYYVRSRTQSQTPLFADNDIKSWLYNHIQWMGTIYCVTLHAIAITDDSYRLVVSMNYPQLSEADLEWRFKALQQGRRNPTKWYTWRSREWKRKFTDLSEFMKYLNQSIAKYVKSTLSHEGHVWRDRFKAEYLEPGVEFLARKLYVDASAVRAGKDISPLAYAWCSAGRAEAPNASAEKDASPQRAAYLQLLDSLYSSGKLTAKPAILKTLLSKSDLAVYLG